MPLARPLKERGKCRHRIPLTVGLLMVSIEFDIFTTPVHHYYVSFHLYYPAEYQPSSNTTSLQNLCVLWSFSEPHASGVLPRDRRLPNRISCAKNWKIRYAPAVTDDFNIAVIRIFTPGLSNTSSVYKHRCCGRKHHYLYLKALKSTITIVNAHSESTLSNRFQNSGTVESAVGFQQRRVARSSTSE